MNKLTAMDSAAPYLSIIDFLKIGQSYFVNHLGLKEEEGGTGIGCMHVESLKSAKYYPRNHPLCQKADTAICGFWGTQPVPEAKDKMSP
ncbi:hypothetical protein RMATCC62417_03791 [Rhizopus microsporus]|nr:hypothetical protein RMATCC62417_03791 [Rhizopus microsporus]